MTDIPPLTQNFPLVDKDGYYTAAFNRWLTLVLQRIGGTTGAVYNSLTVSSGTITWDFNASPQAEVTLQSGVNTMAVPLNLVAGLSYKLVVVQPPSGASGTITWADPPFRFPGGIAPTLTTANNAIDVLEFFCDGSNVYLTVEALNMN